MKEIRTYAELLYNQSVINNKINLIITTIRSMISKCQYLRCKNKTTEYRIVNISKFLQSKKKKNEIKNFLILKKSFVYNILLINKK